MIVLDTHVWVWFARESDKLSARARAALDQAPELGVSAISCWEVAMLVGKGRLTFDRGVLAWVRSALDLPRISLIPLLPEIAVESVRLAGQIESDPADRLIIATADYLGAKLVTKDETIRRSKLVATVW